MRERTGSTFFVRPRLVPYLGPTLLNLHGKGFISFLRGRARGGIATFFWADMQTIADGAKKKKKKKKKEGGRER